MSTPILRFFVILHCENCGGVLKRPNSRAFALGTSASFLALPVPCVPGPMEDARGPGNEDGAFAESNAAWVSVGLGTMIRDYYQFPYDESMDENVSTHLKFIFKGKQSKH